MTTRTNYPNGAPCWADLWTSDVEGSRHFYGTLFGWEAEAPEPEFGGYFSFLRNGKQIAGAMGDMGHEGGDFFMRANDTWKVYFAVDDIEATVAAVRNAGGVVLSEPMAVADLGIQAVLEDPNGATFGLWQAGTHLGFSVLDEPGAPSWFELHTANHAVAVAFYREVLGLGIDLVGDTDEFRYAMLNGPSDCGQVGGIMDATSWLPEGTGPYWTTYWHTDDATATQEQVMALGGSVIAPAEDTPYGRLATVADPQGAVFRLRTPPAS